MQKQAKYFDSPLMRESLKRYMRTQMTLKNIKYRELSERLAQMGVIQEERTLRNKINKGNLSAQLFAFILIALDVECFNTKELQNIFQFVENEHSSSN